MTSASSSENPIAVRPPGWWARLRARLYRWQRDLPLSHEGKIWLLVSLGMLATGLWRGINLIVLLSCCLVAAVLYNWWLARRQLKGLRGQRVGQDLFFAREPSRLVLEVYNPKPKSVSSVWLEQEGRGRYVPHLDSRQTKHIHGWLTFPVRGRRKLRPLLGRTGYPLGLADCQVELEPSEEIIVLPELGRLQRGMLRRLLQEHSPTIGLTRKVPRRHPSAQTDFHGLRSYQPGDSPRWIHWRTTARCGELMVREFEESPSDNLILLIDPTVASPDAEENPHLETAISLAATICWEWCRQKGDHLIVGLGGRDPLICQGVTSKDLARGCLEELALLQPSADTNAELLLDRLNIPRLPTAPLLLITAQGAGFSDEIARAFHRHVAVVDVSAGDQHDFFRMGSRD